ncbi:MAG: methyltransferase domain-containing protein [Chloroflexi bacterium]|nr:methyltransferase domain-containing protein [Chloroflexota bacterium]
MIETLERPVASTQSGRVGAACRGCGAALHHVFVDLGMSPLCESFRTPEQLNTMEPFFPLRTYVCEQCFLAQLEEYVAPEIIFSDYAYHSSYSSSWLEHARDYVETMIGRLALDHGSRVIELGSNDGYLLQYFVERHVPVLGIDPAHNLAALARQRGVPTLEAFFGESVARDLVAAGEQADLIVANNVLAQAPNLHDFVEGVRLLLGRCGTLSVEVPHLLRLILGNQFDTIYHEHFSYFSLLSVERVLRSHRLVVFDVEELPTHGGSLRLFVRHESDATRPISARVIELRRREVAAGMTSLAFYDAFRDRVHQTKHTLLQCLIELKQNGHVIVGYGAPGKANTLLNYCGIRTDLLDYTVDLNPHKQGLFTPGTHIPILHPGAIADTRPSHIFILPWNLRDEIMRQLEYVRGWGCKFIMAIPALSVG